MTELICYECGKTFEWYKENLSYCCSGHECGCMGLPIDPPLCKDCEDKFLNEDEDYD